MQIALDTQSTLGQKTGIGLYTAELLAALRQVAPEHKYVELNRGNDVLMRLDRRMRWQQLEIPRRARAAHADLLHVPGFDAPLWKPCPTILTIHDLIGLLFPANLPPISRFYWAWWLPHSARWADQIIADSEHTKRDITRLLNISTERIEVVYLGVNKDFHPLDSSSNVEAIRQKYNLPSNFILYLGTLEPRKGLDTLISAFGRIAGALQHVLVIAGKRGWYSAPLFRQVKMPGLQQRVRFIDYVADDDRPGLYNLADLFVFPSRYEGFGLPPLEAMACGTPVISSDASSLPEVVGNAALLVRPDDVEGLAQAMVQVLTDHSLSTQMRERSLKQSSKFTWERTARETLSVYEKAWNAHHV